MPQQTLSDLSRLAIHTMTNKPWSLQECIDAYTQAGIGGISVWRNLFEATPPSEAARMLADSNLEVVSLVRSGFFVAQDPPARQLAIDDNRRAIDEAATIGAKMVVLVCGAAPGIPLNDARKQIAEGISNLLTHAASRRVKLAIEPLHPMYAADRSAINRMAEAREVCEALSNPWLGIAVDVYHVWWDPDLQREIELAGRQKTLFAFHLCDWRVQTRDLLNDRGLMGEGCISLRQIRDWVRLAGFGGLDEVEIFSTERWALPQQAYLDEIIKAYRAI